MKIISKMENKSFCVVKTNENDSEFIFKVPMSWLMNEEGSSFVYYPSQPPNMSKKKFNKKVENFIKKNCNISQNEFQLEKYACVVLKSYISKL